jgi:rhamnosyl/mannosyltransferase
VKILHFYKSYYPDEYGGVQQFIRQLAHGGQTYGIETEVLALTPGATESVLLEQHRVHRVKRLFKAASTDFSFRALSEFRRLSADADIIHYHFPYPLADLAHFFARPKQPSVLTYHSDVVAQKKLLFLYRPLMRRFLASVSAVVASSPNYLASSPTLRAFADKVRCIPLGLQSNEPAAERVEYWRKRMPARFFLFVGVFRYYKGLDFLLSAAKGLPCPIVLLGKGGQEAKLKARAAAERLENIHFLDALSDEDKNALLSLCSALVFPSHLRSEAFGITLLEGARYGKPLVCCEIDTGTTYINIANETGLVVPPADPAALRQALLTLWADEALAARLGEGARLRFETLFTTEKMTQSYVTLYRDLLNGRA